MINYAEQPLAQQLIRLAIHAADIAMEIREQGYGIETRYLQETVKKPEHKEQILQAFRAGADCGEELVLLYQWSHEKGSFNREKIWCHDKTAVSFEIEVIARLKPLLAVLLESFEPLAISEVTRDYRVNNKNLRTFKVDLKEALKRVSAPEELQETPFVLGDLLKCIKPYNSIIQNGLANFPRSPEEAIVKKGI